MSIQTISGILMTLLKDINTRLSQMFCIFWLLICFILQVPAKQFSIQSRGYHIALSKATFLLVLWSMLILVLVLRGNELLHWIFLCFLVIEALRVQEMSHGLEHIIIPGSYVHMCWVWHQFDSLKFLKFILKTTMYADIAKLLTQSNNLFWTFLSVDN